MATSEGWYPPPRGGSDPTWAEAYQKAAEMVSKMSLLEKVNVTTGTGWMMGPCVGNTGTTGVGFPSLCLQDGPLGIRFAHPITAFPAALTTAATFNKRLIHARGQSLGREARNLGINALLAPCIGPLGRSPLGGRNWEAFGSDPYLQGVAGQLTVRGIQDMGVMAVVKHWLGNEQERFRRGDEARPRWDRVKEALSANIGRRAVRETYAWPWMDTIREGAAGVMCSYNQVNNSYACQNSWLLNGLLKDELGFQGFVVSDWLAQRTGVLSVLAGMDMTMPGDGLEWSDGKSLLGGELTRSIVNGTVPLARLDDMVLRIVAAWYQLGQDSPTFLPPQKQPLFSSWLRDEVGPIYAGSEDRYDAIDVINYYTDPRGQVDADWSVPVDGGYEHSRLAREIAAEGVVLLKNVNSTLPLSRNDFSKKPKYKEIAIFGSGAAHNPAGPNACVDRGCNMGALGQGWGSGSVEYAYLISPLEAIQARAVKERSTINFVLQDGANEKVNSTAQYTGKRGKDSVCLVFVTADSGEAYVTAEGNIGDRTDMNLWHGGDNMILAVADRCPNTVVIIHSVGPVLMEKWINHSNVKGVLIASLPGQESGTSIVDVLYGDVNPSGHLPYTIGKSLEDYGSHADLMREPNWEIPQQDFTEGVYVDYKWFDKQNITPRYEFGYGQSYTSFNFSELRITKLWQDVERILPLPRERDVVFPLVKNSTVPKPEEVQFPTSWKSFEGFVYPYVGSATATSTSTPTPFVYPEGYSDVFRNLTSTLSSSGGFQGGNPSLWDPMFRVDALVTNVGKTAGKVAAQLYLGFPDDIEYDTPVRQLRGFEKVQLLAGESKAVTYELTRRDVSVWSEKYATWVIPSTPNGSAVGQYKVYVGPSSRGEERGEGVWSMT
ncbi:glycoside hydrolase superfamily [Kalaharituber pfeilii]|nr:glycoside hydrolase superfamily [Kalaharituber pfeilii]